MFKFLKRKTLKTQTTHTVTLHHRNGNIVTLHNVSNSHISSLKENVGRDFVFENVDVSVNLRDIYVVEIGKFQTDKKGDIVEKG